MLNCKWSYMDGLIKNFQYLRNSKLIGFTNWLIKQVLKVCKISMCWWNVFMKAECKAQIKKAISYTIDSRLHVLFIICWMSVWVCWRYVSFSRMKTCVLFCLLPKGFFESGDLITEETCTQNLQKSYHVEPHKGSPIKAKDQPLANEIIEGFFTVHHASMGTCLVIRTRL